MSANKSILLLTALLALSPEAHAIHNGNLEVNDTIKVSCYRSWADAVQKGDLDGQLDGVFRVSAVTLPVNAATDAGKMTLSGSFSTLLLGPAKGAGQSASFETPFPGKRVTGFSTRSRRCPPRYTVRGK